MKDREQSLEKFLVLKLNAPGTDLRPPSIGRGRSCHGIWCSWLRITTGLAVPGNATRLRDLERFGHTAVRSRCDLYSITTNQAATYVKFSQAGAELVA